MNEKEIKRYRLQLDFDPEAYNRVKKLRELAGVDSNGELFGNALRLYEWYLKKTAEGYRLGYEQDGIRTEIDLMGINHMSSDKDEHEASAQKNASVSKRAIHERIKKLFDRIDRFAKKFVICGGKVIPRSAFKKFDNITSTDSSLTEDENKR